MARKPWSKFWSAEYLADAKIRQLSSAEKGVLQVLWALMLSQTDEPGRLIIGGVRYTKSTAHTLIRAYSSPDQTVKITLLRGWVSALVRVGVITEEEDGTLRSERIIEDVQEHEKLASYGRKGAEKRHNSGSTYIRSEATATPKASATADPMASATTRSEEEEDEEAEQRRARVRVDSGIAESQEPEPAPETPSPKTPGEEFIEGIEQLTALPLVQPDRDRLIRSADGKSSGQVDWALERIGDAYRQGIVRSIVPFAERIMRDAPPDKKQVDREEHAHMTRARIACSTLGLNWNRYHVNVLQAVKKNPSRVVAVTRATFEDVQAKVIPDTQPSILERFVMRMETGVEAAAFSPG